MIGAVRASTHIAFLKEVLIACLQEKSRGQAYAPSQERLENQLAIADVWELRQQGSTFESAGRAVGVGRERARQMVAEAERVLAHESRRWGWGGGTMNEALNLIVRQLDAPVIAPPEEEHFPGPPAWSIQLRKGDKVGLFRFLPDEDRLLKQVKVLRRLREDSGVLPPLRARMLATDAFGARAKIKTLQLYLVEAPNGRRSKTTFSNPGWRPF